MLIVVLMMSGGVALGFLLRKWNLGLVGRMITPLVWLLLFMLGVELGTDENVIRNIGALGLEALFFALAAVLGSVLLALGLWKLSKNEKTPDCRSAQPSGSMLNAFKGSAVIVGFFIVGIGAGLLLRGSDFAGLLERASFVVLCCLMFSVGISVGNDGETLSKFRHISPLFALLPLCTIVGSLLGSALCIFLFDNRSLTDCLALGSGLGYYSLSSILITEAKGVELGTVALISNIIRELITLVGAPFLRRFFGPLAPIASGGATTADTTLPVISSTSGKDFVVVSLFHGFVTDFSVPWLVSLFCL